MTIRALETPDGEFLSETILKTRIQAPSGYEYNTAIERIVCPGDRVSYGMLQAVHPAEETGNVLDGPACNTYVVVLDREAAIELAKYIIKQEGIA